MLSAIVLVLATTFFNACHALPTLQNQQASEEVASLSAPAHRKPTSQLYHHTAQLSNHIRTYLVNVGLSLGSQTYQLSVDTGSAITWLNPACKQCLANEPQFELDSEAVSSNFQMSYVDGTTVRGNYRRADLSIGDTIVENTTFGVAQDWGGASHGFLGLGIPVGEASILDNMKAQGLIKSRSYSIQLNSKDNTKGLLVFGAYDAASYAAMPSLPMRSIGQQSSRIALEWNSLSVKNDADAVLFSSSNMSYSVVLDTGFTLSTLPDPMFESVAQLFHVRKSGTNYYVPCQQPAGSVDFTFGRSSGTGPIVISVPFSELAVPANLRFGGDKGQDLCMFGFQPSSAWDAAEGVISFGDTFLRSAYLSVNIDAKTISLAQADPNSNHCTGCLAEI